MHTDPLFSFTVDDAARSAYCARIVVAPDAHGLTVSVEGTSQSFVLDFNNGALRCYVTNEDGEVVSDPVAQIEVNDEAQAEVFTCKDCGNECHGEADCAKHREQCGPAHALFLDPHGHDYNVDDDDELDDWDEDKDATPARLARSLTLDGCHLDAGHPVLVLALDGPRRHVKAQVNVPHTGHTIYDWVDVADLMD
jgi:hypothetical protein